MKAEVVHLGPQLLQHHVDARHVLPPQRAEVVGRAQTQLRVAAVVLDNMADVLRTVRPAPVADLPAEVFAVQARNQAGETDAVCR